MITVAYIDSLPVSTLGKCIFNLWAHGNEVSHLLPRRTFNCYRAIFKNHGFDIAYPCRHEVAA